MHVSIYAYIHIMCVDSLLKRDPYHCVAQPHCCLDTKSAAYTYVCICVTGKAQSIYAYVHMYIYICIYIHAKNTVLKKHPRITNVSATIYGRCRGRLLRLIYTITKLPIRCGVVVTQVHT